MKKVFLFLAVLLVSCSCTGTHSVRISTSGGNFPHEVKRAAAEFIRALQKHEQAVTDGKYYQHKDVNV